MRKGDLTRRFEAVVGRAKWAILAENLRVKTMLPLALTELFLGASLAGLWTVLPPLGRVAGTGLFATALAASAAPLLGLRWPTRRDALARLDRNTGQPHRLATQFGETLEPGRAAGLQGEIMKIHRARVYAQAGGFHAGWPQARLPSRDPYALRLLPVLLLCASAFTAPPGQHWQRVARAFDWKIPVPVMPPTRVSAWVTPPAYLDIPPKMLTKLEDPKRVDAQDVEVPAGSILAVDIYDDTQATVTAEGGLETAAAPAAMPNVRQYYYTLNGNANLYIQGLSGTSLTFRFNVIPDLPPTVTVTGPPFREQEKGKPAPNSPLAKKDPKASATAGMKLPYMSHDDNDPAPTAEHLRLRSREALPTGDPRQAGLEIFPIR